MWLILNPYHSLPTVCDSLCMTTGMHEAWWKSFHWPHQTYRPHQQHTKTVSLLSCGLQQGSLFSLYLGSGLMVAMHAAYHCLFCYCSTATGHNYWISTSSRQCFLKWSPTCLIYCAMKSATQHLYCDILASESGTQYLVPRGWEIKWYTLLFGIFHRFLHNPLHCSNSDMHSCQCVHIMA